MTWLCKNSRCLHCNSFTELSITSTRHLLPAQTPLKWKCQVCSYSCPDLLQRTFSVQAPLKVASLSCHLVIRLEKNSQMRNMPPPNPKRPTRHWASVLLVAFARCLIFFHYFESDVSECPRSLEYGKLLIRPWFFVSFINRVLSLPYFCSHGTHHCQAIVPTILFIMVT